MTGGRYVVAVGLLLVALAVPDPAAAGERIQPSDLVYAGAFRLPDGPPEIGWPWSGAALTFYPGGDPGGPADGFPGSLFGTGHNWNQHVSEIAIPQPVISPGKNLADLAVADTLQDFADVRGGLVGELEQPRVGLEYLPPQGSQTSGKLYFAWAQHMGDVDRLATHGWCELDLGNPRPAGLWRIGDYLNFVSGDYILEIPVAWADRWVPGMRLATGRYRDGGQGGRGPSLLAYGPWNQGNPPPAGTVLDAVELLMYTDVLAEDEHTLNGYHHSDEWAGAAWLTAGDRAAVLFAGTKGLGECWYGCSDGRVWEPPYPDDCYDRGWWSSAFESQLLLFDPDDLAAVVQGTMASWQPQPYAVINVDEVLFNLTSSQQKELLGAMAFDRAHGHLYVLEPLVDEDKPIVHVWRVHPSTRLRPEPRSPSGRVRP